MNTWYLFNWKIPPWSEAAKHGWPWKYMLRPLKRKPHHCVSLSQTRNKSGRKYTWLNNYILISFDFLGVVTVILQHIWYTKSFELRNEYKCLDYDGKDIFAYPCHGLQGNQMFSYLDNVTYHLLCTSLVKDANLH